MKEKGKGRRKWFDIQVSQNGEEYLGSLSVYAKKAAIKSDKRIAADGVLIEVDEYFVGDLRERKP